VIYLDSSVALANLLTEDRSPPESLWREPLISSRLVESEFRIGFMRTGLLYRMAMKCAP
jgi:hypothetical protein